MQERVKPTELYTRSKTKKYKSKLTILTHLWAQFSNADIHGEDNKNFQNQKVIGLISKTSADILTELT